MAASEFYNKSPLGSTVLSSLYADLDLHVKFENTKGLSECYNEFIDELSDKCDIMVFIHDDVYLDDRRLSKKLKEATENFDIVGLAGTGSFQVQSPAIWNNSDKESWSGAVAHQHEGKTWMTSFGTMPRRCIIVDGLFIAVKTEAFKSGLRFDEQFDFHHYDLDFCLTAHGQGLKIGTAPIWVTHTSIGEWRNNPTWSKNESKFLSKWK
jgi:GT2 family glycosyltransferase